MNFSQKLFLLLLALLRVSTIKSSEPKHKAIYTNFCNALKEDLLKIDYDLIRVEGPTPGGIIDDIDISGYYYKNKIDSEDAAKKLYIRVRSQLIKFINEYSSLRPYLMVYPFKNINVSVHIMCRDAAGKKPSKPFISGITTGGYGFEYCYTLENKLEWHKVIFNDQ